MCLIQIEIFRVTRAVSGANKQMIHSNINGLPETTVADWCCVPSLTDVKPPQPHPVTFACSHIVTLTLPSLTSMLCDK